MTEQAAATAPPVCGTMPPVCETGKQLLGMTKPLIADSRCAET
jgi:hypothetical protein